MTPFALSALKYGLFALLLLFIWRSMRWAVRGLTVEAGAPIAPELEEGWRGRGAGDAARTVGGRDPRRGREASHRGRERQHGHGSRAPSASSPLDDTFVSQQHARLFAKNGSWYVEDLGSTNGTFVNDQRLAAPAMVQPGDRVRVGTTVLELRR